MLGSGHDVGDPGGDRLLQFESVQGPHPVRHVLFRGPHDVVGAHLDSEIRRHDAGYNPRAFTARLTCLFGFFLLSQ